MRLAQRVAALAPSATLAITARANELKKSGHDVINFGAGEPDFNTPDVIIDAANAAMRAGATKYTPSAGTLELRKALSEKFLQENGLRYTPDSIVVTSGAKHALYLAFQALLNPGDEVLIPTPYWTTYPEQVKLAEGIPVFISGDPKRNGKIDARQLRQAITAHTRVLILNSPNNPTGAVYSTKELSEIVDVALGADLMIFSDEIYEHFLYEDFLTCSVAALSSAAFNHTLTINGASKTYAMTGWRIGYAAGPKPLIDAMVSLQSQSTSNPTSFAQAATIAALREAKEAVHGMYEAFVQRRSFCLEAIARIPGINCIPPAGAFYVWIDISGWLGKHSETRLLADADDTAAALLDEAQVAVVPGTSFGSDHHVRLSYATSLEELQRGFQRISAFAYSLQDGPTE